MAFQWNPFAPMSRSEALRRHPADRSFCCASSSSPAKAFCSRHRSARHRQVGHLRILQRAGFRRNGDVKVGVVSRPQAGLADF